MEESTSLEVAMRARNMSHKIHTRALLFFFALNFLIWAPWGVICLFTPQAWSGAVIPGMTVFDLASATARTEVRAMYGGLQIAIGLFGLAAILRPKHRDTALLFYVLAFSGLALSRAYGMIVEGSDSLVRFSTVVNGDDYNQIGLGMYEGPHFIFAWLLLLTKPRGSVVAATGGS